MTPGKVVALVGLAAGLAGMGWVIHEHGRYVGAKEERDASEVIINNLERRLLKLTKDYERFFDVENDSLADRREDYIRLRDEYLRLRRACGKPLTDEERARMRMSEQVLWGIGQERSS